MTDQNTNGAAGHAPADAPGLEQRAAELSAQMVRQPSAETPEITAAELGKRMELIREVKRTQMREGIDYGTVPGTDKPGLFKPGAEKLAVLFRLDVQPRNEPIWGPGEHLTVISRATVYHVPTGARLGYGEGICSSRERNRAYRKQERTCPNCGAAAVIKGKAGIRGRVRLLEETRRVRRQLPRRRRADRGAGGRGDREPRSARHLESRDEDGQEAGDPGRRDVGHRRIGDLHPGPRRRPDRDGGTRGALRAGRPRRTQAEPPRRPRSGCAAATSSRPRRCGRRSRPRSTATCQKPQPKRSCSPPRPRAPPAGATAAGQPTRRATRSCPDSRRRARPRTPPPRTCHAGASSANRNPHGARLRVIASARGVGDAELANLIRNAVGQGPIPADRARTALPTMLARISEENSERTVELLDMFYPPPRAEIRERRAGEVTSVDFGAIEPPRQR